MSSSSGYRNILRALRNPNYGLYTAGSGISLIGTWMQRIAIGWLTWELTGSGVWLGLMAFADLFPTVVIGPIAGAAADRWDRLKVTKVSQALAMVQAIILFVLTVTGVISIWALFVLTAFQGAVAAFNQPARLALIPSLVGKENLSAAVGINSVVFNLARFVGPAVAGVIIVAGGVSAAFAANAVSFMVFLVILSKIKLKASATERVSKSSSFIGELKDGVRYVLAHRGIAPILLLLIIISIGVRPIVELMPGFASVVFQSGAAGLAILTSAIGIGAVGGGLWLAGRDGPAGLTRVALICTMVVCLMTLVFVATDSLWVAVPALVVSGFCVVGVGVSIQTLIQLTVDGAMRGRVLSLYGLIFRGAPAIGALIMGTASDFVGLRWPVAIGAVLVLIALVWIGRRQKQISESLEAGLPLTLE
jgi:MFS family permease